MRRRAALLVGALVLTVAGCGDRPAGVDGDLTDGWRPLPAAQQFRPAAGTCHADLVESGTAEKYSPVPCTGPHLAETVAVADLTGAASANEPEAGLTKAYAECSRRATAFLGADWRTGWVLMQPVLPGKNAWSGGARWFRCDVVETSPVDGKLIDRTKSMKAGLRAGTPLRMACADPKIDGEQVTEMHPVACAARHKAEFAGLFQSRRTRSADITAAELEKGCGTAIAKFTGVPDDGDVQYRVGWLGFPPDDTAWRLGDRAIRCFLWLNGEPMTGSYRNAGTTKLKIQYQR
jgi:hypothetical protein